MAFTRHSRTLLSIAARTGATTGNWFQNDPKDTRERQIISPVLSAGTATWNIEGRNGPEDSPTVIVTQSASGAQLLAKFNQLRVNVTAAAGATLLVTADRPALDTTTV